MDVDIAVLGGPGGCTAAIRAARLGDPRPAPGSDTTRPPTAPNAKPPRGPLDLT
jgi:hypothetical protein